MESICREHGLLSEENGVVRVPFLVKGQLITPPDMSRADIESAFAASEGAPYVKTPSAQLIREPIIDRRTLRYTSEYVYQVMPRIRPGELIEADLDALARGPYALSVSGIIYFLQSVAEVWRQNADTADRVRELSRRTSEHPDVYLDGAFAGLHAGLDAEAARRMIDGELSVWNIPGSRFLEGWVDVPGSVIPGLVPLLAQSLPGGSPPAAARTSIRAMPTRQLHITAGNAPEVPIVSALRAILVKSAAVVKSPFGGTLTGALLGLAVLAAAPDHPLTRHLSIVYWQGGDESIESFLLAPGAFDRIVVWGAPDAVTSVQSRAAFTRVLAFNPRYGVSLIGREAFAGGLDQVVFQAAMDSLIYNQKACTAAQVHYVEATEEQVQAYAERLRDTLTQWDGLAPQFVAPATRGHLKRMRRGKYARANWLTNERDGDFASGVVVMPDEFDILDHPLCRLIIVRRVDDLGDALRYLHAGVSTAGVYPEARRIALRDGIAARGVSNILPLGQCERVFAGQPHDGMIVLSQLVDWKNA